MIESSKALLRVVSAFLTVFIFTFVAHQTRITSVNPDFSCEQKAANEIVVEIGKGTSGSDIAQLLFINGVVKSSRAFFAVAVSDKRATAIAPGAHRLQTQLCARKALDQLLDSKRITGLINIFEGAWNSEIFISMEQAGFARSDIAAAIKVIELPKGFRTLEGLLFPAQYSFAKGTSALAALNSMVDRSLLELEKSGITRLSDKYSPQQRVIMASIAQAEGNTQDFTKVARVIINRLEVGMPLQMDSTVHYVKKDRGNIFLSTVSTFLKSPYNTYRNYGLPPGPIGNPGLSALTAVANPTQGDWLYFITVAPFDTRFTSSPKEFADWKLEYKKNLRAGLFRSQK